MGMVYSPSALPLEQSSYKHHQKPSCAPASTTNTPSRSSSFPDFVLPQSAAMDRTPSRGTNAADCGDRSPWSRPKESQFRGSVVNFPCNPHFHPRVAFKIASTSRAMEERSVMLANHALLVKEEGPMGLRSYDEPKGIIFHHFRIHKHEVYAYRSCPDPFTIVFSHSHARDIVFTAGRVIDGPIELSFSS
jgi:hypothetical protein